MKNKLCPYKKTCRDECYGENPCDFARAFDRLAKHLDLRQVAIESLRAERDVLEGTLAMMRFAYLKKDGDCPSGFEIAALAKAEQILGTDISEGEQNDY